MRYRITLLALLLISAAAQAQQWRVAALVRDDAVYSGGQNTFELYDSTVFTYDYTTNRGSSGMLNDSIAYDVRLRYAFNTSLKPYEKWERTYNNDNTLASVVWLAAYNYPLKYQSSDSFTYDNGKMKSHIHYEERRIKDSTGFVYKVIPTEVYQFKNYTDAQQSVEEKIEYYYDYSKNTAFPRYKYVLRYGANGRVESDTTYRYDYVGGWMTDRGVVFKYKTDGITGDVLAKYMLQFKVSIFGLDTFYKNEYTYNTNGELIRDLLLYKSDTGYVKVNGHKYSYHSSGMLQSDTSSTYGNNGALSFRTVQGYTYNSNGLLSTVVYSLGLQGLIYDARDRYYYEAYWPVSAANIATKQQDELQAYPVPATDFVNIKWTTDKPTRIQGRLVNLQGQVVKQWSDNADGDYYKSINTSGLPAGAYFIILQTNNTKVKRSIIKQ